MKRFSNIAALARAGGPPDVVLACGVFDGVHRGHQSIIATLTKLAQARAATPVVVTFDPHPRAVLNPDEPLYFLTTVEQKLDIFQGLGVEAAVFLTFNAEMAAMSPEQFVRRQFLAPNVKVRGICVGANWRFGARGRGDTRMLKRLGRQFGFVVCSVPELTFYGQPVSSTRIREAVSRGRLRFAARLLGRPYSVRDIVSSGRGIGHDELDCPTANLRAENLVLPPAGVYAARARLARDPDVPRSGIAYVGTAPTISASAAPGTEQPGVELHLFDFDGDIYGEPLEVEFAGFIRSDRKFPSLAALRSQIDADIAVAKRSLARV